MNPGDKGVALFYCHGGCSGKNVIDTLGLDWRAAMRGAPDPPDVVASTLDPKPHYPDVLNSSLARPRGAVTGYEWFCAYLAATGSHRQGQDWQCPAHEDAKPSLSVNPAADGTALFYCHSGCSRDEVVAALDLEWRVAINGSDEAPGALAGRLAGHLTYPAPDLSGGGHGSSRRRGTVIQESHHVYIPDQVRLERLRFEDGSKDIKWERKVGRDWVYGLEGLSLDSLPLYESQQVLQALGAGEPIVLCESESSVDALYEAGVYATTWAGGATHPQLPTLRRSLIGGRVVLIPDNDAAGVKCAQRIQEALGDVCRLATIWPDRGQDARDLLSASGADDLSRRLEAVFAEGEGHSDTEPTPSVELDPVRTPVQPPEADAGLKHGSRRQREPNRQYVGPEKDTWTRTRPDVLLALRHIRSHEIDVDRTILASWLTDPALRALVGYRESVVSDAARALNSVSAVDLPAAVLTVLSDRVLMLDPDFAPGSSAQNNLGPSSSSAQISPTIDASRTRSEITPSVATFGGPMVTVWLKEPMWGRDPVTRDAFVSNRHIVLASHVIQDAVTTTLVDDGGEVVADWPTIKIERLVWDEVEVPADATASAQEQDYLRPGVAGAGEVDSQTPRERVLRQHPRAGEPWTPDEDEQLRAEFDRGQKVKQMARTHERSPGAITSRLRVHGLID